MIERTREVVYPALELFAISLASLFFELLVIRWLSCDFLVFSVFKTFPLVACFVGLGVGVAKGNDRLFRYVPLALLTFVALTESLVAKGFTSISFPSMGVYQWMNSVPEFSAQFTLHVFGMAMGIILLLAGPFAVMACLGSRIGVLFNRQKPLYAYCIDIGGAIAGSVLFALLSFLCFSPSAQIAVFAVMLVPLIYKHCRKVGMALFSLVVATAIAYVPSFSNPSTMWTPYGRIDQVEITVPAKYAEDKKSNTLGVFITVNHNFSQIFTKVNQIDLAPAAKEQPVLKTLADFLSVRRHYYALPYVFKKPQDVLILGAGSGSDVAEALRNDAESVDAVELDPEIIKIGKLYNDAYHSPKVHLYCDDARNYINRCQKQYDMIIYGCLDSRVVSGVGSSMRTDSYIHTINAYRRCIALLKPGGIFVLSFGASHNGGADWLRDKIYKTIEAAAGYPPLTMSDEHAPVNWPAFVFVVGEAVRLHQLSVPHDAYSFSGINMPQTVDARILTNDWPYLYIRPVGVDLPYLLVLAGIVVIAVFAGRYLLLGSKTSSDVQLFFLGASFILLELQSISRLSLLFGTTWLTSTVVINGVLLMIMAANLTILRFGTMRSQGLMYAGLAVSLLLSYFLPVELILGWNNQIAYAGHLAVTVLTLVPMFMAGLIFAKAFEQVKSPARSFAFNILGTVFGALLEYVSTYWGCNSLVLIAFALYSVSYAAWHYGTQSIDGGSVAHKILESGGS